MGRFQIEAIGPSSLPDGSTPIAATFAGRGTAFFAILILVTILPLVLLPLSGGIVPDSLSTPMLGIWIVAGFSHVMATAWFSLDKDYQRVIDAHRFRMIGSLALLPFLLAALTIASPFFAGWVIMAYWAWQSHHYNRQNYGILSLASALDRMGPLPRQIGWILNLTTAAGAMIMGTMPAIYVPGVEAPWLMTVVDAGSWRALEGLCLLAAGGLALHLFATNHALRRSPTVLVFLVLSLAFYLPGLFFPSSPITGFWPYAIAHGAQYLVIMAVTARGSSRGVAGLILFVLLAGVLGVAAYVMQGVPWAAFYTGIVSWHFLADARLWRLRDPAVRSIVRERFAFVFATGNSSAPAAQR